ncbi:hypothetical protein Tco_1170864, partial [Tanacetum coccineum]
MAHLDFCDKHNMVAYLEKSARSEGFEQIIDFLSASHIHFALTTNPTIYTSLIQKIWETTALCTMEDGVPGISATIDKKVKVLVFEASIRRHLKLEDSEGLSSLLNAEIFEQLTNIGSQSDQSEDHLRVLSAAKVLAEAAERGKSVGLTHTYTRRGKNVGTGSGK